MNQKLSFDTPSHAHYTDILKRTETVTATEVKNAFQGIASAQITLLSLFAEMMQDFKARAGIDYAEGTYEQHEMLYRQLKHFLREKYHVEDIPLSQLDLWRSLERVIERH